MGKREHEELSPLTRASEGKRDPDLAPVLWRGHLGKKNSFPKIHMNLRVALAGMEESHMANVGYTNVRF